MAEGTGRTGPWLGRLTWLLICFALIFIQLLPLNTLPPSWAGPDLMLVITLAWVARRPDYAPALMIVPVFLIADLLFGRPPGLHTAFVLILTEALRAQANSLRNVPFPLEWATVAFGIVALTLANRIVLAIFLTPQAPLRLTMIEMAMSCMVYPLVVATAFLVFGVSRPAPGEVDALGHRV